MGNRPGSKLKLPSEHIRRRKEALKKAQVNRKFTLNLLPLLLAAAAEYDDEFFLDTEKPPVVSTVSGRRYWLHSIREAHGQDSWLLDYSNADPALSLDWNTLIENASIEASDEP